MSKMQKETKIIFLDVDGVLNCVKSIKNDTNDIHILDSDMLKRLKCIITQTNAKVVISSSWKDVPHALQKLYTALSEYDIECVGCCTQLDFKSNRTHEIKYWLAINTKKLNVINWIAIDDIPLHEYDKKLMKNHFIHTNIQTGLTDNLVKECVCLLNNNHK
eukprot:483588_1